MLLVWHSFTQACWMVFVVTGKQKETDICQQPPLPSVVPYPGELLTHWKWITSEVCIMLLLLCSLKSCMSFSVWLKYSIHVVVVVLSLHHMFPKVLPAVNLFQRNLVCRGGTGATQSHEQEGLCATCDIICHAKAHCGNRGSSTHSALRLITLVSPNVKASVALGDSHACWSKPHSSTRPPLAKAFLKAAKKLHIRQSQEREGKWILSSQSRQH